MHRCLRAAAALAGLAVAATAAPAHAADRLAIVAVGTPDGPALTDAAAPVSILQVTAGSENFGSFAKLPTAATSTDVPVTLSGTDIDEGHLTALPDGTLLMAGYGAVPGTASVASTSSASVPRVVAQIGATGTVTTPTRLGDAFSGGHVTSVATDGAQGLWLSGKSASASVVSTTLGATTSTPLPNALASISSVSALPGASGSLWVASGSETTDQNFYQLGTGLPTGGTQPLSSIFTNGSRTVIAGQAAPLDLDGTPGVDTIYVSTRAHLFKFRLNPATGTWDNTGSLGGTGLNGGAIAVSISGGVAHIYTASPGSVTEQDDTTPNSDNFTNGPQNFYAGAPVGMQFRGIALLPPSAPPAPELTLGSTALTNAVGDPTQIQQAATVTDALTPSGPFTFTSFSEQPSVLGVNAFTPVSADANHFSLTFQPVGIGQPEVWVTATTPDGRSVTANFGYNVTAATDATSRFLVGSTDASTGIDVGGGYVLVGDDEVQDLNLFPNDRSSTPVKTWNFAVKKGVDLAAVNKTDERDTEAAARAGNRIYWASSYGLDKDAKVDPARNTLYATDISGSGADTQLSYVGQYNNLGADLQAWDHTNAHGLGADYFGIVKSLTKGTDPKASDGSGFSIEGIEFAPGSTSTAYVALRAPLEPASNRHLALVVPVTNVDQLVQGNPQTAVHAAFGAPILWDLGGLGVRELRRNAAGQYLIIAGAADASPNFALYVWDGVPADAPVKSQDLAGGTDGTGWEGVVSLPSPLLPGSTVRLLGDRGDAFIFGDDTAGKDTGSHGSSRTDTFTLAAVPAAAGPVGGTVPATLSLTLGAPASFGSFTPGLDRAYTASTTASVISTAGDAALSDTVSGHLANGAFSLADPVQVTLSKSTWTAPATNDPVAITFGQHIGATEPLRTGAYAATVTFTLSTTTP